MQEKFICTGFQEFFAFFFEFIGFYIDTNEEPHFSSYTQCFTWQRHFWSALV